MNARLYFVRHGSTALNSNQSEPERFRAWSNPPLNEDGISDAHKAGAFLADKGISHIFASDLGRTLQTAHIIQQSTHAPVTPVHGLRPWNLGQYTGQPVEPNKQQVEDFQNKTPDQPTPGGESYNEFLGRFNMTLKHLVAHSHETGQPIALVTHTRDINALHAQVKGKRKHSIDSEIPPGGILRMDVSGNKIHLTNEDIKEGIAPETPHFQE